MTLLKCKNGHKWNYQGQNQTGEKATCPKCRKLVTIPSLIIAIMLAFGSIGLVYAEELDLPIEEPYDDKYCTFLAASDHVNFTCTWKWFLDEIIMAELDPFDIPLKVSDLPQHNIDLAEQIKELLETLPIDEPEDQMDLDFQEFLHPDEPLTPEEREIEAAIEILAECRTGLGAFAAYQESEAIEHYTDQSRWQFAIRDNLSQNPQVGNILKGIEECRIMKKYADMNLIGAYELNKILADMAGVDYLGRPSNPEVRTTDQSDASVFTDPVTPKDIEQEIDEMERLRDKLIEERVFEDPYAELPDVDLQPAGLKCQIHGQPAPVGVWATEKCPLSLYEVYILKNWDAITYSDIRQLQCDNFLYIYQHKIGTDDFPVWLNHCVPKVVRE